MKNFIKKIETAISDFFKDEYEDNDWFDSEPYGYFYVNFYKEIIHEDSSFRIVRFPKTIGKSINESCSYRLEIFNKYFWTKVYENDNINLCKLESLHYIKGE